MINAEHPDVVSVFLNKGRQLHTTHSWDFMLLEKNGVVHKSSLWKKANFGEDTIIGNLDTGKFPKEGRDLVILDTNRVWFDSKEGILAWIS